MASQTVTQPGRGFGPTAQRLSSLLPRANDPGVHITTLGADQPGKCELSRDVVEAGLFICDDRDLTVQMGALAGLGLDANAIDAELGDILAQVHPGRTHELQITVYASVGLAFQDLVTGWQVYQAACQAQMGLDVDFLA
ncbi:MAG: hypothetical protein KDI02_20260 [Anaerolineae bacterium]|nr:hypothetical protein [Anaerolineae bacterium]